MNKEAYSLAPRLQIEKTQPAEIDLSRKRGRLTPIEQADAEAQTSLLYGQRAHNARRSQYDFDSRRSVEENTRAIGKQYGRFKPHGEIRARVQRLLEIIEKNKAERIRGGREHIQTAEILESLAYAAEILQWFGDGVRVTFTSEHDDVLRGVDCVVEWKVPGTRHITRLGIDLTLMRRGRDEETDRKLQKKQQGGSMRDSQYAKDVLLEGALRHLDYFKSQLTHGDWRSKRFTRSLPEGKRLISHRTGVYVPTAVASIENPLDIYRFCGDLYDPATQTIADIEASPQRTKEEQVFFAHHPMRIALLESVLEGVRAQMSSLEEQKKVYRNDAKIQAQIQQTLLEFRTIRSELERARADAKGEVLVPFQRRERATETKEQESGRKTAFEALHSQEGRLKKFIQTFELAFSLSLPSDPSTLQKVLYDLLFSEENLKGKAEKAIKYHPFDSQYDKNSLTVREYRELLLQKDIADPSFQEKYADVARREKIARSLADSMELLKTDSLPTAG